MGEKTGTRTKADAVRRAVIEGLEPLEEKASLSDVIAAVNALILGFTPQRDSSATLPDAVSAQVAAVAAKQEEASVALSAHQAASNIMEG